MQQVLSSNLRRGKVCRDLLPLLVLHLERGGVFQESRFRHHKVQECKAVMMASALDNVAVDLGLGFPSSGAGITGGTVPPK